MAAPSKVGLTLFMCSPFYLNGRQCSRRLLLANNRVINSEVESVPDSLLFLDPLTLFLGVDPVKAGYMAVAQMLVKLSQWCLKHQVTIIGTYHASKQKADPSQRYARSQDKILGSTALLGFTGTQMFLSEPSDTGEAWHEFLWNPHHAIQETFYLTRDKSTGLFKPYEKADLEPELYALLNILPSGEAIPRRLLESLAAERLHLSRTTLHRHLVELISQGHIKRVGRGFYLRLRVQ